MTATDLAAIGVGVPGRVDPVAGRVTLAVNLGWHDLPLVRLVAERYGDPGDDRERRPCGGRRAARAAGSCRTSATSPTSASGPGISAGVVLDGRLHRGVRGLAGEIGHVVLDPAGPCLPVRAPRLLRGRRLGPGGRRPGRGRARRRRGELARGTPARHGVDVYREAAAGDAARARDRRRRRPLGRPAPCTSWS